MKIIDDAGKEIRLCRINLGGWLMMEAYFMHSPNWPECLFREGPLTGWETYHLHWKKCRKQMIESWDSKEFKEHKIISKLLGKYVK